MCLWTVLETERKSERFERNGHTHSWQQYNVCVCAYTPLRETWWTTETNREKKLCQVEPLSGFCCHCSFLSARDSEGWECRYVRVWFCVCMWMCGAAAGAASCHNQHISLHLQFHISCHRSLPSALYVSIFLKKETEYNKQILKVLSLEYNSVSI